MMNAMEYVPLKDHTTFRIGGPARFFVQVSSPDELADAIASAQEKILPIVIIGGGSNMLVSDNGFNGMVIAIGIKGKNIVFENSDTVQIRVSAGEILDNVIEWAVSRDWSGIENLSFVPGAIGGLAIQNVNCYGQDASRVIEEVEVYDLTNGNIKMLTNAECQFRYRQSVFNTKGRGNYIILSVSLILQKHFVPVLTYPDVERWFERQDFNSITLREMRNAIIAIRKRKGQDPNEYWSAGSFFKNLLLTEEECRNLHLTIANKFGEALGAQFIELKDRFTRVEKLYASVTQAADITKQGKIKIPVAFILDKVLCIKGMRVGDAQISEHQVINIINRGNATAHEVLTLFKQIRQLAYDKLGIVLENEPELIGFSEQELQKYFSLYKQGS